MNDPKLVPLPAAPRACAGQDAAAPLAAAPDQAQLARELDYYLGRLAELDKLDPHDFTGLQRVYGGHVQRTRALLANFDA